MKKRLVIFTGAGVSAESGLKTFRDSDGLWEEYDVMEVATPEAWAENPKKVLEFYNHRRLQALQAQPNLAHYKIAELEKYFDVDIITQNIDNLHERAGSSKVLHLHGEVTRSRSTYPPFKVYPIVGETLNWGDLCERGYQLRPHVVWFGEDVPLIPVAQGIVKKADILLVVGTSLNVYPAAGIVNHIRKRIPIYLIDPGEVRVKGIDHVYWFREPATTGMDKFIQKVVVEMQEK
jgi:NAD-dependent deacetylase